MDTIVGAGIPPVRSTTVHRMCVEEKRLVELIPQLRSKSHIFYTDPANVTDLLEDFLPSKLWRMNNLYKVKTKTVDEVSGSLVVPFRMKFQQLVLYAQLVQHPRVVVLKSRQIGISTVTVLMYGDDMLIIPNLNIGIAAQNQEAANTLLEKIKFAFESMSPEIKEFLGVSSVIDNDKEYSLSNGSVGFAKVSFRSGTLQRFAWTEIGKIAKEDPKRITETLSGSLQTIEGKSSNWVVNESTAEGDNYFKVLFDGAVETVGKPISAKEVRPLFFSWLIDSTCNSSVSVEIGAFAQEVIDTIEEEFTEYIHSPDYKNQIGNFVYPEGFTYVLSPSQRSWLVGTLKELGYDLELFFREYPHTPASAFFVSGDGLWYKDAMKAMRLDDRLVYKPLLDSGVSYLYNPEYSVLAISDIGYKDRFFICYVQIIETGLFDSDGLEIDDIRVLGEDFGTEAKTDVYAELMYNQPYELDYLCLPHDGGRNTVLKDSTTVEDDFIDMGFDTYVESVTRSTVADILTTRRKLSLFRIDAGACPELVVNLDNYQKKFNKTTGAYEDTPLHNVHSHGADVARYIANSTLKSRRVHKASRVNVVNGMVVDDNEPYLDDQDTHGSLSI